LCVKQEREGERELSLALLSKGVFLHESFGVVLMVFVLIDTGAVLAMPAVMHVLKTVSFLQ